MIVYNFFVLEKTIKTGEKITPNEDFINIYDAKTANFQDANFRTFPANESTLSSRSEEDNNNDSNTTTPTINNHIPRIFTPEIKIVNSTPLNHFNHQNGLSNRKFRRDLTKSR